LDKLDKSHVNLHSLLLMRHGKLVAEAYAAPYGQNTLHRMFSIVKTLNAVAVGLLAEDGRVDLDAPITGYFPELVPSDAHPFLMQMTVRNLLMMRTCHASTTYKKEIHKEWLASFFTTPPTHKPGTVFHYDTSAAHVLCALVERLTCRNMLDYLKDRVLRQIGWSESSYLLKNEFGDSHGGSGLMATPRDILLLGQLLMQGGRFEGKQLLPEAYVKEMTSNLTPNALTSGVISETRGYGYQLWCTQHNGFVCYGLGGQLVICLPEYDLIFVTTADTQGCPGGNDLIYTALYEEILPALDTATDPAAERLDTAYLSEALSAFCLVPLKKWCRTVLDIPYNTTFLQSSTCAKEINDKIYRLEENSNGFTSLSLSLSDTNGSLNYTLNGQPCSLAFGLDACTPGTFPEYDMTCAASGMWLADNTFYIKVHILDTSIGTLHIELVFGEKDVTVFMRKIEETLFNEYAGHFYGVR
jgi:CubicO group peptidase (beta-lactamase class C family)